MAALPLPTADLLRAHLMDLCCPGGVPQEGWRVPGGLCDVRLAAPSLRILPAPPWAEPELRFLVRPEVAERLERAARALPDDVRLGFWEGLRPVWVQRTLWEAGLTFLRAHLPDREIPALEHELDRYVARPDGARTNPPHSTGSAADVAAVDVFGRVLDPHQAWGRLGVEIVRSRLRETGLASYPEEWWHWSYGDEEWARAFDCDPLPFSLVEPAGEAEGPGAGI